MNKLYNAIIEFNNAENNVDKRRPLSNLKSLVYFLFIFIGDIIAIMAIYLDLFSLYYFLMLLCFFVFLPIFYFAWEKETIKLALDMINILNKYQIKHNDDTISLKMNFLKKRYWKPLRVIYRGLLLLISMIPIFGNFLVGLLLWPAKLFNFWNDWRNFFQQSSLLLAEHCRDKKI